MRTLRLFAAAAAMVAVSACGGQGDDAAGEAVEEQYDAASERLDEQADTADEMGNEILADELETKADSLENTGDVLEEKIDDADIDATLSPTP